MRDRAAKRQDVLKIVCFWANAFRLATILKNPSYGSATSFLALYWVESVNPASSSKKLLSLSLEVSAE